MIDIDLHERRETAARMETVLAAAGALAVFGSIFGFLLNGGIAGFGLLLLGLLAFGLARLFDLVASLLTAVGRLEKSEGRSRRNRPPAPPANTEEAPALSDAGVIGN